MKHKYLWTVTFRQREVPYYGTDTIIKQDYTIARADDTPDFNGIVKQAKKLALEDRNTEWVRVGKTMPRLRVTEIRFDGTVDG